MIYDLLLTIMLLCFYAIMLFYETVLMKQRINVTSCTSTYKYKYKYNDRHFNSKLHNTLYYFSNILQIEIEIKEIEKTVVDYIP
jgi:hypothetical protein